MKLLTLTTTLIQSLWLCPWPATSLSALFFVPRRNLLFTIHPYSILIDLSHSWLPSEQWIKSYKFRSDRAWPLQTSWTAARTSLKTDRSAADTRQICEYIAVQWLLSLTFAMYCTESMSVIVVARCVLTKWDLLYQYLSHWDAWFSAVKVYTVFIHRPVYWLWTRPWLLKNRSVTETW